MGNLAKYEVELAVRPLGRFLNIETKQKTMEDPRLEKLGWVRKYW
jgi:hypothetical protein